MASSLADVNVALHDEERQNEQPILLSIRKAELGESRGRERNQIKPEDRYRSQVLLKLVNSQEYRSTVSCQQTARRSVQLFAGVNVTLHVPLERSAVESANSVTSEAGLEQSFRETTRLPMEAFAVNSERDERQNRNGDEETFRRQDLALFADANVTLSCCSGEKRRVAAKLRATRRRDMAHKLNMRSINSVLRCLDWSRTAKAMSTLSKDWTCGNSSVFHTVCTVGNSLCPTTVHHSVDELSPLGDLSVARQEVLHTVNGQSLKQLCRGGAVWSICMQHCCSETRARYTEN